MNIIALIGPMSGSGVIVFVALQQQLKAWRPPQDRLN